ncbi:hypothetical protein KFE25_005961 [Diacronema lutheri]|uniref:Uncharacterized protein n=1 Tax=Diacronema lutheri TaxID=2081491 RepID=A0A8J6CFV5_DIALT|nr:hypothetical protein KFE25_005961 [Diacronema lutheri]
MVTRWLPNAEALARADFDWRAAAERSALARARREAATRLQAAARGRATRSRRTRLLVTRAHARSAPPSAAERAAAAAAADVRIALAAAAMVRPPRPAGGVARTATDGADGFGARLHALRGRLTRLLSTWLTGAETWAVRAWRANAAERFRARALLARTASVRAHAAARGVEAIRSAARSARLRAWQLRHARRAALARSRTLWLRWHRHRARPPSAAAVARAVACERTAARARTRTLGSALHELRSAADATAAERVKRRLASACAARARFGARAGAALGRWARWCEHERGVGGALRAAASWARFRALARGARGWRGVAAELGARNTARSRARQLVLTAAAARALLALTAAAVDGTMRHVGGVAVGTAHGRRALARVAIAAVTTRARRRLARTHVAAASAHLALGRPLGALRRWAARGARRARASAAAELADAARRRAAVNRLRGAAAQARARAQHATLARDLGVAHARWRALRRALGALAPLPAAGVARHASPPSLGALGGADDGDGDARGDDRGALGGRGGSWPAPRSVSCADAARVSSPSPRTPLRIAPAIVPLSPRARARTPPTARASFGHRRSAAAQLDRRRKLHGATCRWRRAALVRARGARAAQALARQWLRAWRAASRAESVSRAASLSRGQALARRSRAARARRCSRPFGEWWARARVRGAAASRAPFAAAAAAVWRRGRALGRWLAAAARARVARRRARAADARRVRAALRGVLRAARAAAVARRRALLLVHGPEAALAAATRSRWLDKWRGAAAARSAGAVRLRAARRGAAAVALRALRGATAAAGPRMSPLAVPPARARRAAALRRWLAVRAAAAVHTSAAAAVRARAARTAHATALVRWGAALTVALRRAMSARALRTLRTATQRARARSVGLAARALVAVERTQASGAARLLLRWRTGARHVAQRAAQHASMHDALVAAPPAVSTRLGRGARLRGGAARAHDALCTWRGEAARQRTRELAAFSRRAARGVPRRAVDGRAWAGRAGELAAPHAAARADVRGLRWA